MMARRRARESALQILFQTEFERDEKKSPLIPRIDTDDEVVAYSNFLVGGVSDQLKPIDALIQTHSLNWKVQRMALVDKNILRIAIFEIIHSKDPVPPKSAINEAIELAKKYGSSESKAFVNGILDQIIKTQALDVK